MGRMHNMSWELSSRDCLFTAISLASVLESTHSQTRYTFDANETCSYKELMNM